MDTALQQDLRRQLEAEREQERARLEEEDVHPDGKSVHNIQRNEAGMDNAGQQIRQRSARLGAIDHTESRLGKIEAALERMDEGTYGTCEVGGEQISEERLRAYPLASRCIDHAEENEQELDPAARIEG